MEPVLRQYRQVFHDEDGADFEGTDLVEHRIITGEVQPIRNLKIESHNLLGRKWKAKLGTCFRRESLNLAILRGMLRPSLFQKNQLTAGLCTVSVWTFVL